MYTNNNAYVILFFLDTQMVSYLLWPANMGGLPTRVARGAATPPSPNPSCSAARDLLLHYHWLVKLAIRKIALLVYPGSYYRIINWVQTSGGWYEVGAEAILKHVIRPRYLLTFVFITTLYLFITVSNNRWLTSTNRAFKNYCFGLSDWSVSHNTLFNFTFY